MRNPCSMCKRNNCRVKQLDDDVYCHDCLDNYRCSKCNMLYDGCVYCHKNYVTVLNGKLNVITLVI